MHHDDPVILEEIDTLLKSYWTNSHDQRTAKHTSHSQPPGQ